MYIKTSELGELDVINISDGRHLGNVCDVDIDPDTGLLRSLILERPGGGFWRFTRSEDIEISWADVVIIGVDVVLVKLSPEKTSQHRTWRR